MYGNTIVSGSMDSGAIVAKENVNGVFGAARVGAGFCSGVNMGTAMSGTGDGVGGVAAISTALLTQQLPPLSKFDGKKRSVKLPHLPLLFK